MMRICSSSEQEQGLRLKKNRCECLQTQGQYLECHINPMELSTAPHKMKAVTQA